MDLPQEARYTPISRLIIDANGDYQIENYEEGVLAQGKIPSFKGLDWNRVRKVGKMFKGRRKVLKPSRDESFRPCDINPAHRRDEDGNRISVEPCEYFVYNKQQDKFDPLMGLDSFKNLYYAHTYIFHHNNYHNFTGRNCVFFKTEEIPALKDLKKLCTDNPEFDADEYIKKVGVVVGDIFRLWEWAYESESESESESDSESESESD